MSMEISYPNTGLISPNYDAAMGIAANMVNTLVVV